MDIFDVLTAISKRKMAFMHTDMNENDALIKAEFEISKEYHIPLLDIKKLLGVRFIPGGLVENKIN
ncbi:MAG: hypothetical protein EPN24_01930 [Candidatus Methanoperedens sp.]|nr:MAG: hypothetical protein EPN24_01930 [Candidatus Methanoperedens sp.]